MNYWEGKSVASNDSTEDSCAFLENSCDQERDARGDESTEEVNRIIAQQFSLFQQGSQVAVSYRTEDCGNYRNTQPSQRNRGRLERIPNSPRPRLRFRTRYQPS